MNQAFAVISANIRQELSRFEPFNRMDEGALNTLIAKLSVVFIPAGEDVLTPESGTPRFLWIVKQGKIQSRQAAGVSVMDYTTHTMQPGECFPLGSVIAQRPSTNAYTALEDSFCYRIPAEDFIALTEQCSPLQMFCLQYVASLLNQSRKQLQTQFSQRASESQAMTTPLGQLLENETNFSVLPTTPLRSALEAMHKQHLGNVVVVDEEQKVLGVLTRTDVIGRVLLAGVDLSRPITEVMSADPFTLPSSSSAYDAALIMANRGIHHILVVDANQKFKGVISERNLFALQRIGIGQIRSTIEASQSVSALQQASLDIRQLALNLLQQGIAAEQLTQFISALNDALTRRILELQLEKHDLAGVEWSWLAFGSEGRHEQTLSTDQDNGILFICPEDQEQEALRQRLLAFASAVNHDLAACGFPLCKGNIMASNPDLCLTLEEWRGKFATWIREPRPDALLNATIFFDFRVLVGKEALADNLRHYLLALTSACPAFLKMLAANALDVEPPLGTFRDFVVDSDGKLDLKIGGARLFVDGARILALRNGVEATSTQQRLRLGGSRAGIPPEDLSAMIDGFHFIQQLRLRNQNADIDVNNMGDNIIKPDDLNELDRRILKEAFKQAKKLQIKLKLDYQL